jgi:L-lactate dehydrogenase complex protein LldF
MNSKFRARIRQSLANETLQAALDANAERRINGRMTAFASLPDWRERRQQAHALRAEVIEHLDAWLEQFIHNATQNGMIVHRAATGEQAIRIVTEIAAQSQRRPALIAKSKSMVSEEINLNHALEAQGMRVVETDLGEYIVQLRNERPSHIITPAVHLRRQEVGQLFHEKLGVPYTEDIPTMTQTARRVLREVFLTADVGISGVNFGVAETGGICLVTNEGNGRMVTTLPRLHIALMGIERLVRSLDDLALLLSLLPRSATGQTLSAYTQIIHQPLPAQQRHIILLDNGRSRLRHSPLREALYCIRCGACLNACPVFREIGGHAYDSVYPGPIGSVLSAGLFGSEFVPLAQASSLCGACKEACPVDIDLPKLLTRVRAGQFPPGDEKERLPQPGYGLSLGARIFLKIYARLAAQPRLFAISQKFAWLGTFLLSPFSEQVRLPAFTGWGYSKDLPRFARRTFRDRWQENRLNERSATSGNVRLEKKSPPPARKDEPAPPVSEDRVEQFIKELTRINGQIVRTKRKDVTNQVLAFLQARDICHIHLEPQVLDEKVLEKAGITFSRERDAALRAGVTKALCGVAESGSVLEADGPGDKLCASLLPEIHLTLLSTADLYATLREALPLTRERKSAVFISGPSRTGDIEMSHTIGVHGPRELVVFLVDD